MVNSPTGCLSDTTGEHFDNWYLALDRLVTAAIAYARFYEQSSNGILFPTLEAAGFLFTREEEKLLRAQHTSPRVLLVWCPFCVRLMDAATALGVAFDDYVTLPSEEFRRSHFRLLQQLANAAVKMPAAREACYAKSSSQNR